MEYIPPFTHIQLLSVSGTGFIVTVILLGIRVGYLTSTERPPDMFRSHFIEFCGKAQISAIFFLLSLLSSFLAVMICDFVGLRELEEVQFFQFLSYLCSAIAIAISAFFYVYNIYFDRITILFKTHRPTFTDDDLH
jgi:hypothetical protein